MVRGALLAVLLTLAITSTQGSLLDWPKQVLALPKSVIGYVFGDREAAKEDDKTKHPPSAAIPLPVLPEPKPDAFLLTPQILTKYDYQSERHVVRTKDDYLITLDRIPHGKKKFVAPFNKPVILVRSMFSSSNEYLHLGPQDALAYKLADAGFDVWMANLRGVFQSQGHMTLVPTDPHFWNFSWHEMGVFDITATIDYVINHTRHHHVHLVGYDMGATATLVALSEQHDYNSKVRLAVLMAPLAFTEHMDGVLKFLSLHIIPEMFGAPSSQPIMPHTALAAISDIANKMCSMSMAVDNVCGNLTHAMRYIFDSQMTLTEVPTTVDQSPDMESLKTLLHYVQGIRSGKFQRYDLGIPEENMMRYGSGTPPEYDLSKVKAPVAIFMSQQDTFASPVDVERLRKSLPHVVDTWYSKELTHLDFIFNDRAHHHMYKYLIQLMSKY